MTMKNIEVGFGLPIIGNLFYIKTPVNILKNNKNPQIAALVYLLSHLLSFLMNWMLLSTVLYFLNYQQHSPFVIDMWTVLGFMIIYQFIVNKGQIIKAYFPR